MSDDDARPSGDPSESAPSGPLRTVRDALLLLVVAVVLVGGLIHYGIRIHGRDDTSTAATRPISATATGTAAPVAEQSSSPAAATSSPTAAELESGPTAAPDTAPAVVTCWNGRQVSALHLCSLPSGTAGLRWVFPSFSVAACHRAPHPAGSYRTVVGWECFAHADGQPVAITYEQVTSAEAADRAVELAYPGARKFTIPGPHGGRCTWFDRSSRPARVTGLYDRFPYAVSVYAPTPQAAKQAWATLVHLRSTRSIRGLSA